MKIGVETYVTVKVRGIDEKIREEKSRRIRKKLVILMQVSMVLLCLTTYLYIN